MASSAAMATLLNRQKPIARSASAWLPEGAGGGGVGRRIGARGVLEARGVTEVESRGHRAPGALASWFTAQNMAHASVPATMRAMIFERPGAPLRAVEMPVPRRAPGQ